jgi:hypothetical protein
VSTEPVSGHSWIPSLLLAATAALIMTAVAVGALILSSPAPPDPEPPAVALRASNVVLPAEPAVPPPPDDPPRVRHVDRTAVRAVIESPELEVVFDPQQKIAIARLLELARTGTVVDVPDTPERIPLAVEPLSIPPINPPAPTAGLERSSS